MRWHCKPARLNNVLIGFICDGHGVHCVVLKDWINMSEEPQVFETIRKEITENDIVVFMKGNANFPQCGFSAQVVEVMKRLGINDYRDVNVLEDMDIREGIKAFSDWPTIPQLYVKGEFVGGCDIVREMYLNGELVELLQDNGIAVEA